MNEKKEDPAGTTAMDDTWVKSMGEFLGGLAQPWVAYSQQPTAWSFWAKGSNSKAQANIEAAMKNWQAMMSAMATPESISSLLKSSGTMPEMLLSMAQSSMGGYVKMQEKMIERMGRVGASADAYTFQDIDENIFRIWTDVYEKEFKQFFQIPQLGLMRTYQEKANQVLDKYNFFQSTLSEYLNMLSLPFRRAMEVMQDKISEMTENGTLPEDSKVYYNMWVKVLEGHYMTLYQTPEYVETMARTINALADFSSARDAVFEDMVGLLPIARKSELDDMARDLYELKKRLRRLEKEQKNQMT